MKLRQSEYAYVEKKEGAVVFYSGLTLQKCYGNAELLGIFRHFVAPRNPQEVAKEYTPGVRQEVADAISMFSELGLLVSEFTNEYNILKKQRKKLEKLEIRNLRLLVSARCNQSCSYCQIERNMDCEAKSALMTKEIAEASIELFRKCVVPTASKTISITGGEPLFNFDVVKYICQKSSAVLSGPLRLVVFTNGTLLTKKIADFLAEQDVLVLISLDGPSELNDKIRIFENGKGSFDATYRGYKLARQAGCHVGVSSVLGRHNVTEMDGKVMDLFLRMGVPSIGVNFCHLLIGKNKPARVPMKQYVDKLLSMFSIARAYGVTIEQMLRVIHPFVNQTFRLRECQAVGTGITVDAQGKVGTCKSLLVGGVLGKSIWEVKNVHKEGLFQTWGRRSPVNMVGPCQKCFAVGICGGGCSYDAYCAYGTIDRIHKDTCVFSKTLLQFLLWDLYEHIRDKMRGSYIRYVVPSVTRQREIYSSYVNPPLNLQQSVGH